MPPIGLTQPTLDKSLLHTGRLCVTTLHQPLFQTVDQRWLVMHYGTLRRVHMDHQALACAVGKLDLMHCLCYNSNGSTLRHVLWPLANCMIWELIGGIANEYILCTDNDHIKKVCAVFSAYLLSQRSHAYVGNHRVLIILVNLELSVYCGYNYELAHLVKTLWYC